MNKIILLLIFVYVEVKAQPIVQWSTPMGESALSVACDSHGNNITIGGLYPGSTDMDPGPGVYTLSTCMYITKMDSAKNLLWAKCLVQGITAVAVDSEDNIYVTGNSIYNVDFDPGPATFTLAQSGSAYFFKLSPSGDFIWARWLDITDWTVNSVAIDVFNDIYITAIDFGPRSKLFKLDSDGNIKWTKTFNPEGKYSDLFLLKSVVSDKNKNCYLTGAFHDTIDFDPGPQKYIMTSNGAADVFFIKLSINGDFEWAKQIGGTANDLGYSLTTDAFSNLLLTGFCSNSVDFDPGQGVNSIASFGWYDIFVDKFDPDGNFIWAKRWGGRDDESGTCIRTDQLNNIYIAGYFKGTIDADPGPGSFTVTTDADGVFVNKLDPSGNFVWAFSGTVIGENPPAIALTKCGQVYIMATSNGFYAEGSGWLTKVDVCTLITGLEETDSEKLSAVYPNPSSGKFMINTGSNLIEMKNLKIKNSLGDEILNFQSNDNEIDLSSLNKGIYIIEISEKRGLIRKKIIIE